MRKFKFVVFVLLVSFFAFALAACDGGKDSMEYTEGTELKLAVAHNNMKTTITFEDTSILSNIQEYGGLANGKTYSQGDLKPVWEELEKRLKVSFENVYSGQSSVKKEYDYWKSLNFDGVDVVVGNADDISEDGKLGKIVNLADYLDYMPNLKKFLEENPIVYLSLLSNLET
ncbi:MAG TPA: hypothetical protein GYA05_05375 [Acholeplasmataceae bacterium]|nr:hypothetical protein [Acholeplasmataceae bacterium]